MGDKLLSPIGGAGIYPALKIAFSTRPEALPYWNLFFCARLDFIIQPTGRRM
jgi:hypothetical protein